MESIGYKFIYTRLYEPTETDFTSDIVKMRAAKVQNLVLIAADWNPGVRQVGNLQQPPLKRLFEGGDFFLQLPDLLS